MQSGSQAAVSHSYRFFGLYWRRTGVEWVDTQVHQVFYLKAVASGSISRVVVDLVAQVSEM